MSHYHLIARRNEAKLNGLQEKVKTEEDELKLEKYFK